MRSWSRTAAVIVTATASALAGCGSNKATIATFAGVWQAHGRTLTIGRGGDAKESVALGLGRSYIAVRFDISDPSGTPDDATATATVTAVTVGPAFPASHPPPRIGESATIRLRVGVITEGVTGAKYCGSASGDWLQAGCGA